MQKIKCTLFNAKTEKVNNNSFNVVLSFKDLEDLSPVDNFSDKEIKAPEPLKVFMVFNSTGLEDISKNKLFNITKVGQEYIVDFLIPDKKLELTDDTVFLYSYYLTSIEESISDGYYILNFEDDDGNYISLCTNKEITDKFNLFKKMDLAITPFVREKD